MQKLEDEPAIETRCLHPAYEGLRPRDTMRAACGLAGGRDRAALCRCLHALSRATGWLNFRMRSMLVAVASYHLWLDWRATGPHLARMFTDYEPGIHWPQVQMQSGTTGMNTVRIYNPVKQGHDQDPDGRVHAPLGARTGGGARRVPADALDLGGGRARAWARYPEPVVDVAEARESGARKGLGRAARRGVPGRGAADREETCEPQGWRRGAAFRE
jgi:deoxyribodipyrimidine photo-lyase